MTMLQNGSEWRPRLSPGVAGDEPIEANHAMYPAFDAPSLADLLAAFAVYAASDCRVRAERMDRIQEMILSGEYAAKRAPN